MSDGENISSVLTCESAADSYEHVISFAGNGISPEKRTKIDQQCAEETKTGTGSCSGTDAYDSSQSALSKYNIQCGVNYEYPAAVLEKLSKTAIMMVCRMNGSLPVVLTRMTRTTIKAITAVRAI